MLALAAAALAFTGVPGAGATARSGGVVAFDANDGARLWSLTPPGDREYRSVFLGQDTAVVFDDNCVDTGSAPTLRTGTARRTANGAVRWRLPDDVSYALDTTRSLDGRWGATARVPVDAGGVVVAGGTVYDARRGTVRWTAAVDEDFQGVSDDLVFARRRDADGSEALVARSRRSGDEQWTIEFGTATTMMVVDATRDTVVVAAQNGSRRIGDEPASPTTFVVVDADAGRERSRFDIADPQLTLSDAVITNGALVVSERGRVVAHDLDDGAVRWARSFVGHRPEIVDADSTDRVVVQTSEDIVILDAAKGSRHWTRRGEFVSAAGPRHLVVQVRGGASAFTVVATSDGARQWRTTVPGTVSRDGRDFKTQVLGDRVVVHRDCLAG